MFFFGLFGALGASSGAYVPLDSLSDEQLLIRVGNGDKEAFSKLYENTKKSIYSFILSIMKNPDDSEEIMQETYVKIWQSAPNYIPQGKPLAWMFTIARNFCMMKFRSEKHEADMGLSDLSEKETGEYCTAVENATDRMVLETALRNLGEEERTIVLLHASAGMKHREIADELSMPLATILSKYNRAVKKLQKILGEGEAQ